jgi:hypothetical protein
MPQPYVWQGFPNSLNGHALAAGRVVCQRADCLLGNVADGNWLK